MAASYPLVSPNGEIIKFDAAPQHDMRADQNYERILYNMARKLMDPGSTIDRLAFHDFLLSHETGDQLLVEKVKNVARMLNISATEFIQQTSNSIPR